MGASERFRGGELAAEGPQTRPQAGAPSVEPAGVRAADPLPACLNCGAALTGAFCAACGQRDVPPYPSVRELAADAAQELSGWDGRLMATIRTLIRHPGVLTREFLEGRRARYISPVRLYLAASVVYFVLAASAPEVRLQSGEELFAGVRTSTTVVDKEAPSRPEQVGNVASASLRGEAGLTPEQRAAALEQIEHAPAPLRPFLRRSVADPEGFRRGIIEAMPRMLFALLPVFAAIVALFYRGRKYPEHLYFAIHLQAFIFLALAFVELTKFTRLAALVAAMGTVALVTIPIYATLAFRRVYGGSIARTLANEVAIAAIYGIASFAGFAVMVYWVSLTG